MNEQNNSNGHRESTSSSDSTASQKNYNPTTAIIRTQIETWLQDNTYASLSIASITPYPESCITFEIKPKYLTNAKKHQFQVFCNEKWQPLFMTSDSSSLEEQINVLNAQIEMQNQSHSPFTITNLLGMFAIGYNEKYEPSKPTTTSLLLPLANTLQFDHNDSDMELEEPMTNKTAYEIAFEQQFPKHVTPTEEDWEKKILPEAERILYRENFQPFEVDEWLRRIQVQLNRGDTERALDIIQHDILGGALAPSHIRQFFSGKSRLIKNTSEDKNYVSVGASPECVNRLQTEISQLKEINTKDLGFMAAPCGTDLLHWSIKLTGFGTDSAFGQELMEWHLSQQSDMNDQSSFDAEVVIEMKFPPNFPITGPTFRIIRPRLVGVEADLTASTTEANDLKGKDLTASAMLDKQKTSWDPNKTIVDIILGVRSLLLDSGIHVDVKSGGQGYSLPTVGNFWRAFTIISPTTANKPELENGGKIIMPATVLEELSQFDMESPMHHVYNPGGMWSNYGKSLRSSTQSTPMVFELSTDLSSKRSFCGVEEFTAPEGSIVVPKWMMDNLGVWEGVAISVRRVKLPRGSYVKLQPHTSEFLKVNDTKAMLEWVLPKFVVLSVGDTIVVPYRDKKYSFNILEVKPGRAIHIIDSDITTDFAPPLDGDTNTFNQFAQVDNANTTTPNQPKDGSASPEKESKVTTVGRMNITNQTEGVDYKICNNCMQHIPIQSYNMHSLSCARMNWFCSACNVVVQKAQKEQHMKEAHTLVPCECGLQVESRLLTNHKSNDCPRRMVPCAYCPLQMPYVEKFEHESKCGAQTERCEICSKYVAKKDMPVHIVDCSQPKRTPPRPKYRQVNYDYDPYQPYPQDIHPSFNPMIPPPQRTPQPTLASSEDTMACPICSQSFQQFDDLQVHMVTDHPSSLESFGFQDNNTQQNTVQD